MSIDGKVAWVTGSSRGIGAARISREVQADLVEAHSLRRLGTPDDVARAALFLASDDAGWITGIVLDVSGGITMVR
jgi:3-oxoacyl-[acyl-carrier protein] reductase